MDKRRIAIIGSGDLGQSIAYYGQSNGYNIAGFYDDYQLAESVRGIPVLGKLNVIIDDFTNGRYDALLCGIGYKHFNFREVIYTKYHVENHIPFATIIDKSCHVDATATIGEGTVLFPGVFLDKGVIIEENVLLNICVTIAHDSTVKAHSFLSPRVAMAGFSTIGKRCMIGINSTIIDNITICDDVRVGGGNLVIKDLAKPGLYVGSPAKWIKE